MPESVAGAPVTAAMTLDLMQREVRRCTRCVDGGFLPEANPVFRGRRGATRMVIGQAPGPRSHAAGVPWSGSSGRLLAGWFARAGYPEATFLDDWYFTSLTRCFPGKGTGGGDRVPSRAEQRLCADWLSAELALVRPDLIVTLGRLSTERMVPETRGQPLTAIVGRTWSSTQAGRSIPIVPLPHPSGISRWLNLPANRALVDGAIDQLARRSGNGTR